MTSLNLPPLPQSTKSKYKGNRKTLEIYHTFGPWVYFNDPLLGWGPYIGLNKGLIACQKLWEPNDYRPYLCWLAITLLLFRDTAPYHNNLWYMGLCVCLSVYIPKKQIDPKILQCWPDLSKDPNMYSSYTGSLLSFWTTVRSCTKIY